MRALTTKSFFDIYNDNDDVDDDVYNDNLDDDLLSSTKRVPLSPSNLKLVLGTGCKSAPLEVDRDVPPTVATVVSSNKSKDHGYKLAKKYKVILADDNLAEIMLMHGEFYLVFFLLTRRNITQFGIVL